MVSAGASDPSSAARSRGRVYFLLLVAVIALALIAGFLLGPHIGKSGVSSPLPISGSLDLGPAAEVVGSTYELTVTSSSGIHIESLEFGITSAGGTPPGIEEVCVANPSGFAIGLWNGTGAKGWDTHTTSTDLQCLSSTAPAAQIAPGTTWLSDSDEIFFYLLGALAPGVAFTFMATGFEGVIAVPSAG